MMGTLTGLFRRWLSQDVARTNAAQAAVRLQHRRRAFEDVDAFLAAHHHQQPPKSVDSWPRSTTPASHQRHVTD